MKPDEFRRNTDLYSADLSRWPVTLVRPALDLVENDREAAEYFEKALALDAALRRENIYGAGSAQNIHGAGSAPGPDLQALEARIMKAVEEQSALPAPVPASAMRAGPKAAFGALFAVALLAVFAGLPQPPGNMKIQGVALSEAEASLPADVLADIGGPDDPDFWEGY